MLIIFVPFNQLKLYVMNDYPVQVVYHLLVKDKRFGWCHVASYMSKEDAVYSCKLYKGKSLVRVDRVEYTNVYV